MFSPGVPPPWSPPSPDTKKPPPPLSTPPRHEDMYASAAMAFLHHLAAFTLVAALAVEVALFQPPLTVVQARRLQRTDLIFGVAAVVVLAVGLLRGAFFEKGPGYHLRVPFFLLQP